MASIRSKNTRPEQAARRELWHRGYRFRKCVRTLPGTPDIVLPMYRTAIFVNGCFWHGHPGCAKYTVPKTNVQFWKDKVSRNQNRDTLNNQRLEAIGWNVITIWECELSSSSLADTIDRVESDIKANKAKWEVFKTRRRHDRQFALEQARKRREIYELIEKELNSQFHIPAKIRKMSKEVE